MGSQLMGLPKQLRIIGFEKFPKNVEEKKGAFWVPISSDTKKPSTSSSSFAPLHDPQIKLRQLLKEPVDFLRIQVKIRQGVLHAPQIPERSK